MQKRFKLSESQGKKATPAMLEGGELLFVLGFLETRFRASLPSGVSVSAG